jgi:hypothetical protein
MLGKDKQQKMNSTVTVCQFQTFTQNQIPFKYQNDNLKSRFSLFLNILVCWMLCLAQTTKDYDEFLEWLGPTINIYKWKGYSGGLDTSVQGNRAIYLNFENVEIIFHVSTMLTVRPHDSQMVCIPLNTTSQFSLFLSLSLSLSLSLFSF